jgi:predicted O-methyltransferase YrrM
VAEASALEDNTVSEPRVQAIVTFNRQLCQMKEFSTSILPLRDGVAIAVKL